MDPRTFERTIFRSEAYDGVVGRVESDTALIAYGSLAGDTPMGAELTHGNLVAAARAAADLVGARPGDVTFGGLPLTDVFCLAAGLNASMLAGGCLRVVPRFDPVKTLEIVEHDHVKTLLGVPAMFAAILHHPEAAGFDTSSLELCVSSGGPMPAEVLRGVETAFGCKVLEGYGPLEATGIASFNRADQPGSIGTPVPGTELRLGGDGELLVRGPTVMKGYWKRPDATAEALSADGWLRTGDMAHAGRLRPGRAGRRPRDVGASRAGSAGPRARHASMSRRAARRWRRRR